MGEAIFSTALQVVLGLVGAVAGSAIGVVVTLAVLKERINSVGRLFDATTQHLGQRIVDLNGRCDDASQNSLRAHERIDDHVRDYHNHSPRRRA